VFPEPALSKDSHLRSLLGEEGNSDSKRGKHAKEGSQPRVLSSKLSP
jgi:hypothetical protein